ncbi:MEDS domain-containing protein [Pseudonocardia sp. HH130630-07]|uniref:MEDS domain-containing protein n=1 Tax=Pseudonocardia sp. HH130630-07 TaxID=1690815 RepID=UPI000839B538|nr:MEDS domain-containing protein [Pseudonocardia sp. HH130630-07]
MTGDPSSHSLTVPVSDEQLCEVVSSFLADGLEAGERVAYFDDHTADAVLSRMQDDGVEIIGPLRTGQFQLPNEGTRAAMLSPPEEFGGVLTHAMAAAVEDGWAGLRVAGQMEHGEHRIGAPQPADYDRVLADTIRGHPVHALCIYDHARCPDELIAQMRAMHDVELASNPLHDDTLLRITELAPAHLRLAGEVDHGNRPQVRRVLGRVLDRVARGEIDTDTVVADLSALRFCDVAAAVSVVHAAEELPATMWLRLENVRPGVARLLDRCGASFAGQLEVQVRDRPRIRISDVMGPGGPAA